MSDTNSEMEYLTAPDAAKTVAEQVREMGLSVGDVIVGREALGRPNEDRWQEHRLELLYIGAECCAWKVAWRNHDHPEFIHRGESANWKLHWRRWRLVSRAEVDVSPVETAGPPPFAKAIHKRGQGVILQTLHAGGDFYTGHGLTVANAEQLAGDLLRAVRDEIFTSKGDE